MRHVMMLFVCAAVVAAPAPARAQAPDTARANRMLTRLTTKLRADRTLPDSLRRLTPTDLASRANTNQAVLLDDPTSGLLLRAMAANARALPETLCGSFMGGSAMPTPDLDVILPYADSTTLERWSTVLEGIVRARAAPIRRPAMSDSMMKEMILRLYLGLKPSDQLRLMQVAQHPPPSRADACWSMRVMLDAFAALPDAEAGPFVRGTFGQLAASGRRS
jgi:hypothetical protein